jgi:F420-non-reducing hydrogenase small subunit
VRRPLPEQQHAVPRVYGPLPNVVDQGAKIISAVASIIDSKDPEEIEKILASVHDFTGYAYRFGMAGSLLQRSIR